MKKQSTPMEIWNTVCDANVDLFHARMNFSAEMFDLYTKWPRKSFGEVTQAMKAAHLESLKLLAEKTEKPAAKPAVKAGAKKKAKALPKPKPVAAKAEAKPKAETKVVDTTPKPAAKAGAKPVTLPDMPDFSAKPRPATPAEAPKPAESPEKDS